MKEFEHLIDHYKNTIRIDGTNAWDIIKSFKDAICKNTGIDHSKLWETMKDFHEELVGKHFNEPYALYETSKMYHVDPNGNEITHCLFNVEDTKKIHDKHVRNISKDITIWDLYVALNAQYHDNINLYKKWFNDATEDEIKNKVIEATIVNWFEDKDASIEKVWEYFRAI